MSRRQCWMVRNLTRDGGGNVLTDQSLVVRRTAAIGDVIAATVISEKLVKLGFDVTFQAHPATHCCLRRMPHISNIVEPGGFAHVNLDGAYERDPARRFKHFTQMFFEAAQAQLQPSGFDLGQQLNCRPRMYEPKSDTERARQQLSHYPRPWVFVCPRSDNYACRQVPDTIWSAAAARIQGTKFWIGRNPAPGNFVDLQCRHFDNVITYLSAADMLISVDTGPMHVGAALGIPLLCLGQSSSPELHLSDQVDYLTIWPGGKLDCLNCQKNLCPIDPYVPPCQKFDPEWIAAWANARLRAIFSNDVSAVIPVFRPPVERLNRCISAIIDQVQEVVVTYDGRGHIPDGAMRGPKIRYVQHPLKDVGYGRNVNFGARHTCGKWIWAINDDFFAAPNCLEKLLECAKPGVGLVGHLLRYPDGRIQHGGKFRNPGMRGWGHISQGKMDSEIREPTEMENVTGASILIDRKAFYEVNANDEDFFFYAVDDDLCLSLRQKGYKIMFTPHAEGIHEEAATSRHDGRIREFVLQGNSAFDKKWGWWVSQNLNTIPGKF